MPYFKEISEYYAQVPRISPALLPSSIYHRVDIVIKGIIRKSSHIPSHYIIVNKEKIVLKYREEWIGSCSCFPNAKFPFPLPPLFFRTEMQKLLVLRYNYFPLTKSSMPAILLAHNKRSLKGCQCKKQANITRSILHKPLCRVSPSKHTCISGNWLFLLPPPFEQLQWKQPQFYKVTPAHL